MRFRLAVCALGIMSVSYFPVLPPALICLPLLLVTLSLWSHRCLYPVAALAFGLFWGTAHGYYQTATWLDAQYRGINITLQGVVAGLPQQTERGIRFDVLVDGAVPSDQLDRNNNSFSQTVAHFKSSQLPHLNLQKVVLNWYGYHQVEPGQAWQFEVRLKRPRGSVNPGGFDYQAWLMRHDYDAVGYVRNSELNRQLEVGSMINQFRTVVDTLRWRIKHDIEDILKEKPTVGLIVALIIGDKTELEKTDWAVLKATGTIHLMIISGLHIGFIAAMSYWFVSLGCRMLLPITYLSWGQPLSAISAILAAISYAAFAGFSLPTQRAVIMIVIAMVCIASSRKIPLHLGYFYALLLVLMLDPLAAHSAGFWLSFGAVGSLLYAMSNRVAIIKWKSWFQAQWVVFLGLSPLLLYLVHSLAILSPLVNIIAIPIVSLLVVPLAIVGAIFLLFAEVFAGMKSLADIFLLSAEYILSVLWTGLCWLEENAIAFLWQPSFAIDPVLLCLVVVGTLWVLAPKGLPAKYLGLFFALPFIFPFDQSETEGIQEGAMEMTVLDVGQGLAVVVETKEHTLIFDTGARYSAKADAGSHTLVPFLSHKGIKSIDKLVISHNDNDHVGGAASLIAERRVAAISAGNPLELAEQLRLGELVSVPSIIPCQQGDQWNWDGVQFEFLNSVALSDAQPNDQSCVLLIDNGTTRVLIPGDIEKRAERALLQMVPEKLRADVLIAPHHGSKTSSTVRFVAAVSPRWVIFSAGYKNQFGHPHSTVLKRYHRMLGNSVENPTNTIFNTAVDGAIALHFSPDQDMAEIRKARISEQRYWFSM